MFCAAVVEQIFFSFCFLLWGLSAVASSVNLLVLKFMTISLEEEEQGEDELHEMGANVVTLEEEVERSYSTIDLNLDSVQGYGSKRSAKWNVHKSYGEGRHVSLFVYLLPNS